MAGLPECSCIGAHCRTWRALATATDVYKRQGLNEATIAKYIREQESHDIALDKLGVKEYEDPFKRR